MPSIVLSHSPSAAGVKGKLRRDIDHKCCHSVDPLEEPDEDGAELAKEARVWKVYIKEADRWDAELVDGWNKSLDVILVFAALFSAVSTAFLIESSGMLKQDPNDISAAALLSISQVLVVIASNSSANLTSVGVPDPSTMANFTPPHNAILINTLWYLSLSLSLATSFLAMLAKDWCHSFFAGRTGHPWDQAQRRQRKWIMIKRWKMQELIAVLPSLIHLSLLLFVVGLCLYVWELNFTPAIPVICVSGTALAFYLWSSVAASIWEYFPYTTIVSTVVRSTLMHKLYRQMGTFARVLLANILDVAWWIIKLIKVSLYGACRGSIYALLLPLIFYECIRHRTFWKHGGSFQRTESSFIRQIKLLDWIDQFIAAPIADLAKNIRSASFNLPIYAKDQGWDPDHITSQSLKWLIQNCETPRSVDIALQAIAGASSKIPKEPLNSCQAALQILRRLVSINPDNRKTVNTFARALKYLGSDSQSISGNGKSGIIEDIKVFVWDLKPGHERHLVNVIQHETKYQGFIPTEENLNALSVGNISTLHSIRVLENNCHDAAKTLNAVARMLFAQLEPGKQLHLAGSRSLINAASLLISCSMVTGVSLELATLCIENCGIGSGPNHKNSKSTSRLEPISMTGAILVIYTLLHSPPNENSSLTLSRFGNQVTTCVEQLRGVLTTHTRKSDNRMKLLWVGCLELLSNQEGYAYGLEQEQNNIIALKDWSRQYYCDILTYLQDPNSLQKTGAGLPEYEFSAFCEILDQVYKASWISNPQDPGYLTQSQCPLPEALYSLLAIITCLIRSNHPQLFPLKWSTVKFPELTPDLLWSLKATGLGPEPTSSLALISLLVSTFYDNNSGFTAQFFSATQLWLLLYLIGDCSTDNQKSLNEILEGESRLAMKAKGVYQISRELESYIISYYANGWHLGIYSCRVIECIFMIRGERGYELLANHIRDTLNHEKIPAWLRGLSSFSSRSTATPLLMVAPTTISTTNSNSVAESTTIPDVTSSMTSSTRTIPGVVSRTAGSSATVSIAPSPLLSPSHPQTEPEVILPMTEESWYIDNA